MREPKFNYDQIDKAILEFLSWEYSTPNFFGFRTQRVYEWVTYVWEIPCSLFTILRRLRFLKSRFLVEELKPGFWRGLPFTRLDEDVEYEAELLRRQLPKKERRRREVENFEDFWLKLRGEAQKHVDARVRELEKLGWTKEKRLNILNDLMNPFPQIERREIIEHTPQEILKMVEEGFRSIEPLEKRKRLIKRELQGSYVNKKGNKVYLRSWGKAKPWVDKILLKLLKEIEEHGSS